MIVFDAADLHAESAFWAGLLGGTVQVGDRWHSIWVDGTWQLGVQLVPGHVPPEWPDGTPQQVHFDLYFDDVRDLDAAHEEVIGLGGRLLKETADRSQVGCAGLRRSRRPSVLPVLVATAGGRSGETHLP